MTCKYFYKNILFVNKFRRSTTYKIPEINRFKNFYKKYFYAVSQFLQNVKAMFINTISFIFSNFLNLLLRLWKKAREEKYAVCCLARRNFLIKHLLSTFVYIKYIINIIEQNRRKRTHILKGTWWNKSKDIVNGKNLDIKKVKKLFLVGINWRGQILW